MAATTQPDGFLALPAELQVKIYGYVLAAAPKTPGPGNLALYAGLLLSCKKVASDFEYEWAKYYNARLQHIVKNTCFRPLPVKQYGHAARLRISVTQPGPGPYVYEVRAPPDFMEMTRFYTLRLFYPARSLTVEQFLSSGQALQLEVLRSGVASSGGFPRVDFRAQEIHCSCTPIYERQHSQNSQNGSSSDHVRRLTLESIPYEIRDQIWYHVLSESPTMEQICDLLDVFNDSPMIQDHLMYGAFGDRLFRLR
ncbi:hypothetical protein J4E93_008772 [Alternaria ventricosa]|uniref:uncharacterized protein n=1 Tax=Alternaria ventricosa TaxID=1187951 RepID=UPI0020C486C7|nr:uncharacterized protein J4E93_008772 [Alternaria ventricosa]KAI4639973.1 hypothetical protein J4E93_008772 [Alternaria ventricosa]